ncbi:MAG: pilus assembly protein PilZ [Tepidanaerobacter acetatoxydans]|uniref:flagellar brake protein n=1 Tax=Tepidanaerobacter acetatoxydans TaxID=499229 RepID=UPI0026F07635|nr:flagellar brake domain-containing protein [Tepidanaerobacter acetatoxydans]NLU09625.1 pilus assembly protein PilZ [Tepidanaerobacter acetatoxydans]
MSGGFLEIGMKVTLGIQRENEECFFPSKVEDIISDCIVLGMPIKEGRTFFVSLDEKINVYFPKKGSFYCLEGLIEDKKYDPIPVITIHPISLPYKKQKRSYFRLKISLKTYVKLPNSDDWIQVYTRDISAGGAKFSYSSMIKEGSIIEVIVPDILDDMSLKSKVVRTEKNCERHINIYDIAIKFIEIDKSTCDKIVKFIFAKQRELMEKGIE